MIDVMEGASVWSNTSVAVVSATGWARASIVDGQRELERIQRELDAAFAALVIADGGDDRDATARVARAVGVSTRCARERVRVARVCDAIPAAHAALAGGEVSSEHVSQLAQVADDPDAGALVEVAAGQTPEEFRDTVMRYRLAKNPADVRRRQREARGLTFFRGDHGCLGVRGMFPPVEGEELRNTLTAIADAQWRIDHPDRAPVRGGHGGDSWPARMADALIELIRERNGASYDNCGSGTGAASPGTAGDGAAGSATTANRRRAKRRAGGKPAVVITIDAETLDAHLVGHGPIPLADAVEAAARGELYAAVRDVKGEILKFGRSKRFASPMQNLALVVRDQKCVVPGCDAHWTKTAAHHLDEVNEGGLTNLDRIARVCDPHHTFVHVTNSRLEFRNGQWVVEPKARSEPATDTG